MCQERPDQSAYKGMLLDTTKQVHPSHIGKRQLNYANYLALSYVCHTWETNNAGVFVF